MNYFKSNFDEQHQYYKDFGEVLIKKTEENRTLRMKELGRHKSYVQDSTTAMNVTRVSHSLICLPRSRAYSPICSFRMHWKRPRRIGLKQMKN